MDYTRCTRCRNPIRVHQRRVQHPSGQACFHDDCWVAAQAEAQRVYAERAHDEGPAALLTPYVVRLAESSPLRKRCERPAAEDAEPPSATVPPGSAA